MPRHEVIYDKKLKETPEFKSLYNKWQLVLKLPHSAKFNNFQYFYDWSIAHGFENGATLKRIDDTKPYSPTNCKYVCKKSTPRDLTREQRAWISLWNETVNRIRCHYGMELFVQEGDS